MKHDGQRHSNFAAGLLAYMLDIERREESNLKRVADRCMTEIYGPKISPSGARPGDARNRRPTLRPWTGGAE